MRPVRMRIPAARSSVSILIIFRSITAIADEIDDEYEGADYDDYDTNWFDDYDDDEGDYDY